jgi:hypothetical protein
VNATVATEPVTTSARAQTRRTGTRRCMRIPLESIVLTNGRRAGTHDRKQRRETGRVNARLECNRAVAEKETLFSELKPDMPRPREPTPRRCTTPPAQSKTPQAPLLPARTGTGDRPGSESSARRVEAHATRRRATPPGPGGSPSEIRPPNTPGRGARSD